MKQGRQPDCIVLRVDVVALASSAGFQTFERAFNLIGDPEDPDSTRGLSDAQIHLLNEPADHIALAAVDICPRHGPIALRIVAGCHQQRISDGYDRRIGRCALQRLEGVDEVWIGDGVDARADEALPLGAVLFCVHTRQKLTGDVDVIATDGERDERAVAVA
jgi:hypothetical protein